MKAILSVLFAVPLLAIEPSQGSKVVQIGDRDVVPIMTQIRFTTLIVLPEEETVLDFLCGDCLPLGFWEVGGHENYAFIKPGKENSETNINLITASGNIYSFSVKEGGPNARPDLKVFVSPKGKGMLSALNGQPKFVASTAVSDYAAQVELAKLEANQAREDAEKRIEAALADMKRESAKAREQFAHTIKFEYRYEDQSGFNVRSIFRDDKFTYIRADPQETPALYEVKDGKPSLIEFQFANGLYTVPKILSRGYLAIGRRKLHFTREEN